MQDFLRGKNGRGPSTEIGEAPPESKWKGEKLIAYGPSGFYNFGKIYPTYRYFKENIKNIRTQANKLFKRGESESGDIYVKLQDKNFTILYNKNESLLIKMLPGSRTFLLYSDIDMGSPVAAIAFLPDMLTYVYIDSMKVGDYGKKWIPLTDPIIYSTSASSGQSSASSAYESVKNNGLGQSSASSLGEAPSGNVVRKELETVTLSDGQLYPTYEYFIKNIEQIKIQLEKDYTQPISIADNSFEIKYRGESDSKNGSRVFFVMSKGNRRRIKAKIRFDPDLKMQEVKIMTDELPYGNKWISLPDSGPIYSTSASSGQSSASSAYESVKNNGALKPARSPPTMNDSLRLPNRPKTKKTFAGGKRRRNKTKKVHRRRRL